ncbi:MAG: dTMP kinase [Nitrospirae bacterium]|nr:dTMP kinase [Nitrospirota bacterium]
MKQGAKQGGTGRGIFITGEGVEGSGKTTQLARLATSLRTLGYEVLETREPGGTPLAEQIRTVLLNRTVGTSATQTAPVLPWCEAHLVLAARTQHVAQVIRPALRRGAIVICDRFVDSTLAYQGYGRGLSVPVLRRLNTQATEGLAPDLTLLFDVSVRIGLARRRKGRLEETRIDRENRHFHEKVRRGFLALAARVPRRLKVIDARQPPHAVSDVVAGFVEQLLRKKRKPSSSKAKKSALMTP